ncbi:MAG: hypothetical protein MZU97_01280 [Bacillus subtilis]|nr:hypothetical protein [Bacillus subtilis]
MNANYGFEYRSTACRATTRALASSPRSSSMPDTDLFWQTGITRRNGRYRHPVFRLVPLHSAVVVETHPLYPMFISLNRTK